MGLFPPLDTVTATASCCEQQYCTCALTPIAADASWRSAGPGPAHCHWVNLSDSHDFFIFSSTCTLSVLSPHLLQALWHGAHCLLGTWASWLVCLWVSEQRAGRADRVPWVLPWRDPQAVWVSCLCPWEAKCLGASAKRGRRTREVREVRRFHDTGWLALLDVQLSWGMNLLCDSLIHLEMMPRRTSASLVFCGQYLWGVGSQVWEILSFFHNLQIFSIFSSFFWPWLTPGDLKPTVCARFHSFPEVAWKHGNYNTGEEHCPSNPSWNLCSGDCSPLQRLVLKEHLWLGRQLARQPILNQDFQQTYSYGKNFQPLFHACYAPLLTAGHLWWGEGLRGAGERQGVRVPGAGWHILLSGIEVLASKWT